MTSPELRGYKGYGAFSNFQKMNPRFQGFRSSEAYGGLLLMIFLDIPRVTWLRRLRCFFKFSTTKKCQTCLQVFLGCPQGNKFIKVTKLLQFFLTNTFKVTGLRGYGDEKCLIHPRILTYLQLDSCKCASGSDEHNNGNATRTGGPH